MPWNWIVLPTMPAPAAVELSTFRYWLASVLLASLRPSSGASCLSGRIAIRLPPPLTHAVSADTWPDVSGAWPSSTTSNELRTELDSSEESSVVNACSPSLRRISPM